MARDISEKEFQQLEDSLLDFASQLQDFSQVIKSGLDNFKGVAKDITGDVSDKAEEALTSLQKQTLLFTQSIESSRQFMSKGEFTMINDMSQALREMYSIRDDLAKKLGDTKASSDLFRSLEATIQTMEKQQDLSEALQSNLAAASHHAGEMARRFGGFLDKIPYVGSLISESLGLSSIRRRLASEFSGYLQMALTDSTKIFQAIKGMGVSTFSAIGKVASSILTNPVIALIALVALAVHRFLSLEKAVEDFRREVGLAGDQTASLERTAQEINVQFKNFGVEVETVYKSVGAIVDEFGMVSLASKKILSNMSLFQTTLGISEKTSAGFSKNMSMISGMSLETASNFQLTAYNLAKSAGVAPVKVIQDMAEASEDTLIAFAGVPNKLLSATIKARQLGTTINDLSKNTRGLLEFQSSISAEMEASTLLGQNINLQRARELRFQGKVVEAQEEIIKQVQRVGDFNKLNVFQQEALAKATGSTVAELRKQAMLQQLRLRFSGDISKLDDKSLEAIGDANKLSQERLNQMIRESDIRAEQTKALDELKSLGTSLAQIFVPIISLATSILVPIFKIFGELVRSFVAPIQKVVQNIGALSDGMESNTDILELLIIGAGKLGTFFGNVVALAIRLTPALWVAGKMLTPLYKTIVSINTALANIFPTIMTKISELGRLLQKIPSKIVGIFSGIDTVVLNILTKLSSMGTRLTKIANILLDVFMVGKSFGKMIPIIGWVLLGVEAIIRATKSLFSIWESGSTLGDKIVDSLKAVPMALFDAFMSPFKMILNWVGKLIGQSDLGDKIIGVLRNGVAGMLDILYSPFQFVWDLFTDGWNRAISNFLDNYSSGVSGVGKLIFGLLLWPYKMAWNWLSKFFLGNSPSKLGLDIVKGLAAVRGMIFDSIASPFKSILSFVKTFVSEMATTIWSGIKTLPSLIFSALKSPFVSIYNWITGVGIFDFIKEQLPSIKNGLLTVLKDPFVLGLNYVQNFTSGMIERISSGIKTLPSLIFSALKSPFIAMWDWLKTTFFGNSPSQLGLNIVKGISAVTGLISDILLAPFKLVQNVASKIFETIFGKSQQDPTQALTQSLSDLSEGKLSLIKDVASLLSSDLLSQNILKTAESIDNLAGSINKISADNILTLTAIRPAETTKEVSSERIIDSKQPTQTVAKDDKIVEKLSELIQLMKDGGISVNLDGRKVSRQLVQKVY